MNSTYSFLDLNGVIDHPSYGSFNIVGQGLGEATVSMATDKTVHDVAADGVVMISKMAGNNGSVTVNAQQTSDLHKFLLGLYNYLLYADTSEWAMINITLRNVVDGTSHFATGVSFQKVPDKPYQAQGQRISWVLMAADIQHQTA